MEIYLVYFYYYYYILRVLAFYLLFFFHSIPFKIDIFIAFFVINHHSVFLILYCNFTLILSMDRTDLKKINKNIKKDFWLLFHIICVFHFFVTFYH